MHSSTADVLTMNLASDAASPKTNDVVELGLLLPANRAMALMRLAQDRHQTVGQILRSIIDRELSQSA